MEAEESLTIKNANQFIDYFDNFIKNSHDNFIPHG